MVTMRRMAPALVGLKLLGLPLVAAAAEPERVVVQHILIAFRKSVPDKQIERTKGEARALAEALLERARKGDDFDALVKEFTDDRVPGIMLVTNRQAPRVPGGTPRGGLVQKFGDVAFQLDVGEVGLANYHAEFCPYGWHVIKRLE